jgi:hypothetical protein
LSAVRIDGNGSASSLTSSGRRRLLQRRLDDHLADALERVDGDRLAGQVAGVRIELDPLTMMSCPVVRLVCPLDLARGDTICIGIRCVRAIIIGT